MSQGLTAFVPPFVSTVISLHLIAKLLPNRLNRWVIVVIAGVYGLWFVLRDYTQGLQYGTQFHFWMNLFINGWTLFVFIVFFKGSLWRRLIIYWFYEILYIMCQTLAFMPIFLFYSRRGYGASWGDMLGMFDTLLWFVYIVVVFVLFGLLGHWSVTIWRRLLLRRFSLFYVLFIALPVGQMYSLTHVVHPSMGDVFFGIAFFFTGQAEAAYFALSILGALISLAAFGLLFFYIVKHEQSAGIEAELTQINRAMELEQAHYAQIQQRSEETAKISHDFNIQLTSIHYLLRTGEKETAQQMIAALLEEMEGP